ncbi:MAG: hypothetical protein ACT4TC_17970 [Myxococcaceae bacterium]
MEETTVTVTAAQTQALTVPALEKEPTPQPVQDSPKLSAPPVLAPSAPLGPNPALTVSQKAAPAIATLAGVATAAGGAVWLAKEGSTVSASVTVIPTASGVMLPIAGKF